MARRHREAKSAAHEELGKTLRTARQLAGASTRVLGFSSGHICNVEGGHVGPSRALAEVYIALGADRANVELLLDRIMRESQRARQFRQSASRAHEHTASAPQMVDVSTQGADIRRHYRVDSYEVEFEFTGTGAIGGVTSTVALRAVSNDVTLYFTGHALDDSNRPPLPPRVTALVGGRVERINVSPVGAFDVYLRLDSPMQPDDSIPHQLSYVVEFDDDRRADPTIVYFAPPGARAHRLVTQFAPSMLPRSVWSFAVPDAYLIDRPQPSALLEASPTGRYQYTFNDLVEGWHYGFTWIWHDAQITMNSSEH